MSDLKRELQASDPRTMFIRHLALRPHVHGGRR